MTLCPQPFRLFVVFCLASLTTQVDIQMTWHRLPENWQSAQDAREVVGASFSNVLPGTCCKPHNSVLPYLGYITESTIRVGGLQIEQFAAGWAATGEYHSDIVNCTGAPVASFHGPGQWYKHIFDDEDDGTGIPQIPDNPAFITAASWVDLRTRFPASSKETRYLHLQGVKSLVWGKDTWSAASDGVPLPKMSRRGLGKLNDWAVKGTAYIAEPPRWIYPDMYTVNGTNYTDKGEGVFKSVEGLVLDLGGG